MKRISVWAKNHPGPARVIIVVSFLLLTGLGFTTGILLQEISISLPVTALLIFAGLYAAGFIGYPVTSGPGRYRFTRRYVRQKTCDLLLAGSSYLMILYMGNHREQLFRYSLPFNRAMASSLVLPADSTAKTYKSIVAFSASLKDASGHFLKWKERKKLMKEQIREIKQAKELSPGGKAGLIVLSIVVALLLISLVAALSCSIGCGGSGALAVIVAIGGTALVIWLLVKVIRNITRKNIKSP